MPKGVHNNHSNSSDHHKWQDRIISSHGYPKVRVGVDHPLADPNGYAYEHLLVWVGAGKRRPNSNEVLHHKNGKKLDNRLKNLEIVTISEHAKKHNALRNRDANGRFLPGMNQHEEEAS